MTCLPIAFSPLASDLLSLDIPDSDTNHGFRNFRLKINRGNRGFFFSDRSALFLSSVNCQRRQANHQISKHAENTGQAEGYTPFIRVGKTNELVKYELL